MTGTDQNPWRGAGPELVIAAVAVAAAALAALAVAGWPGLAAVAIATAVLALAVLRGLAPRPAAQSIRKAKDKEVKRSIAGYSQRRYVVAAGISSQAFYESSLRPALEHLLAARLAESHGVNLYTDPAAARALFCRGRRDEALWPWIDPTQQGHPEQRGIPRRTLTRLIDRLEQL
jgi:hypothetical protein